MPRVSSQWDVPRQPPMGGTQGASITAKSIYYSQEEPHPLRLEIIYWLVSHLLIYSVMIDISWSWWKLWRTGKLRFSFWLWSFFPETTDCISPSRTADEALLHLASPISCYHHLWIIHHGTRSHELVVETYSQSRGENSPLSRKCLKILSMNTTNGISDKGIRHDHVENADTVYTLGLQGSEGS